MMKRILPIFMFVSAASAQCVWLERGGPGPGLNIGMAAAHDPVRQRTIMHGFNQTWKWNGDGWIFGQSGGPPFRIEHAMAFDHGSAEVILFGGRNGSAFLGDTWSYDGDWRQIAETGPSPRAEFAMASDTARQRLVLFGGALPNNQRSSETWEWDGVEWLLRASTGPDARNHHAMAYDSVRARTVLFGGLVSGSGASSETWEWDGQTWSLRASAGPPARSEHTLAFDPVRARAVLFGGRSGAAHLNDLWEWDGQTWVQHATPAPPDGPRARRDHVAFFDGMTGRTFIAGGQTSEPYPDGIRRDTWSWDGAAWRLEVAPGPLAGMTPVVAYDTIRHETLTMSGYTAELWAWDGDRWILRSDQLVGYDPEGMAAAFDQARGELVAVQRNNTWIWNGSAWTPYPGTGPGIRQWHGMTYDPNRQRIVLYGGQSPGFPSTTYDDTWEWDGAEWVQLNIPGPGPHAGHRLAFDAARNHVVMLTRTGETWAFDGAAWTQLSTGGPGRISHAMAYHPQRQTVMIFGGNDDAHYYPVDDMWEWNGQTWTELTFDRPRGRELTDMAWDAQRQRMVLVGGAADVGQHGPLEETWELLCDAPCYANCDNSTVEPILNIDDFTCFINEFALAQALPPAQQVAHYANCDASTTPPVLNIDDFTCFINAFAAGCP